MPRKITDSSGSPESRVKSAVKNIIAEILLTALVLGIFAFFHVLLPRLRQEEQGILQPAEQGEREERELSDAETEALYCRRGKFFGSLSHETEIGENYYKSPEISIEISRHTEGDSLCYYVADIIVPDIERFQNGFAIAHSSDSPVNVAEENGAVLAMNGDYCMNQKEGFLVRNGQLYLTEQTKSDICVLYYDGSIETYGPSEYRVEELLEKNPYQVWKFGPELLDKNGGVKTDFNISDAIKYRHPRSALGYYEPGHYCFVVVDGRQPGYSDGMDLEELSLLFKELGCKRAFNMDGGASSCMVFMGELVNRPCGGGREVSDMLIIKEKTAGAGEEG